jgi:hypothetical protein
METTPIPAKVLNIDRLGDQFLITVQVRRGKYNGTFNRLTFGENKPQEDVPALDDSVSEPFTDITAP